MERSEIRAAAAPSWDAIRGTTKRRSHHPGYELRAASKYRRIPIDAVIPRRQRMTGMVGHFHVSGFAEGAKLAGRVDGEEHCFTGILVMTVAVAVVLDQPLVVARTHDIFDPVRRGRGRFGWHGIAVIGRRHHRYPWLENLSRFLKSALQEGAAAN